METFCFLLREKVICLASSKRLLSHVLNQDSKLLPHKWWHTSWFFRSSRQVGKDRGRRQGYMKGKKKGDVRKPPKLLKRGWFGFFWNHSFSQFFQQTLPAFWQYLLSMSKVSGKRGFGPTLQFSSDTSWFRSVCSVDNCQLTVKAFQSLGTGRSGQAVAEKLRKGISLVLSWYRCDVTVRHQEAEIP